MSLSCILVALAVEIAGIENIFLSRVNNTHSDLEASCPPGVLINVI
jgi:hypothetical protein